MKFYIDENLSPLIGEPAGRVYRKYQFRTPAHESLRGVLDVPLFNDLALREFDAIITHDGRQLQEDNGERQALREAGLHWIGLPETKVSGAHGVSILAGTLLAAFPRFSPSSTGHPARSMLPLTAERPEWSPTRTHSERTIAAPTPTVRSGWGRSRLGPSVCVEPGS